MPSILTNLGPTGSATTIWAAKVNDVSSVTVNVTNIAGSTITVESSADNSSYSAIAVGQNVTAGNQPVTFTNGQITANGRYVFPTTVAAFLRVRISTYVGPGNVVAEVDYSVEPLLDITRAIDTTLVATGASQTTALPIQALYNRFGTVAASTGAILPLVASRGFEIIIRNAGANSLTVYPPVGYRMNGGAVNSTASVGSGGAFRFVSDGDGNWWTF